MTPLRPAHSTLTLQSVLHIMQQLSLLLVRHGIGHAEFSTALKPVFLQAALQEAERIGAKQTDSSISLLSGLHRRDVNSLREEMQQHQDALQLAEQTQHLTVPTQTIARWLSEQHPLTIPFSGDAPSFESIVRSISNDRHPRSVLEELIRLGVVQGDRHSVTLLQRAFVADASSEVTQQLFRQNVADHIAAAVHNIEEDAAPKFLEQSVFSTELTPESIAYLHSLVREKWTEWLPELIALTQQKCDSDQSNPSASQRFRVGIYSFSESLNPDGNKIQEKDHKEQSS